MQFTCLGAIQTRSPYVIAEDKKAELLLFDKKKLIQLSKCWVRGESLDYSMDKVEFFIVFLERLCHHDSVVIIMMLCF